MIGRSRPFSSEIRDNLADPSSSKWSDACVAGAVDELLDSWTNSLLFVMPASIAANTVSTNGAHLGDDTTSGSNRNTANRRCDGGDDASGHDG